ncbi:hypothetical protein HSB1_40890 [Halogranum salarium B-1]|uniref:Uncharacterized protein n=1 Tax=Halogranum salarium B-1 TaxID=1210908 RepID=J2ZXI6_9EURY|nr:hypothetical protein HSB1_40890 [Halogranum salarium B-1]
MQGDGGVAVGVHTGTLVSAHMTLLEAAGSYDRFVVRSSS